MEGGFPWPPSVGPASTECAAGGTTGYVGRSDTQTANGLLNKGDLEMSKWCGRGNEWFLCRDAAIGVPPSAA
ncbi:hypothetical protein TIFTF001_001637 [Ficus carica]|uniref:Uncharacterized protein n=1 Tax=Ficus carica TaxID=3494 RepID=A0AA87ZNY7_FICCA|nr:hypothetical protein TIFTF001_001637 [Ficus carica]